MKRSCLLFITIILSIFVLSQTSFASSVTIDATTGMWSDGGTEKIIPNCIVTFDFRFTNTDNKVRGFTNPFVISGPASFTPVTGDTILPGFTSLFDVGVFISYLSADGIGADTVSIGGARLFEDGMPVGFNEVVFRIKTGGVQQGETLCIDKVEFPQNHWKWIDESLGDVTPDWYGPFCYLAEVPPCLPPTIANCIDTIKNDCDSISYDFDKNGGALDYGFIIVSGPGTINSSTGEWSYIIPPEEAGQTDTLVVGITQFCECYYYDSCTTILKYGGTDPSADFTGDCSSDISDLVFLVEFIFLNGPAPVPLLVADLNGDSEVDISDLVMMVEYIFGSGGGSGGDAPEIIGAPSALSGTHCDFLAFDFNVSGSEPNWSVNIGTIDANGVWSYTPSLADVGHTQVLTVTATDNNSTSVDVNITFTNDAPVPVCVSLQNVMSGFTNTFQFSATDCDPITFHVVSDDGLNASIDPNTGLLSVNASLQGHYTIIIEITDGNMTSECQFELVVV